MSETKTEVETADLEVLADGALDLVAELNQLKAENAQLRAEVTRLSAELSDE